MTFSWRCDCRCPGIIGSFTRTSPVCNSGFATDHHCIPTPQCRTWRHYLSAVRSCLANL